MSFWASGSEPCCTYKAYPLPSGHTGVIEVVPCSLDNIVGATHESVIINPNQTCTCTASSIVSTETTTWGRVKALYQ